MGKTASRGNNWDQLGPGTQGGTTMGKGRRRHRSWQNVRRKLMRLLPWSVINPVPQHRAPLNTLPKVPVRSECSGSVASPLMWEEASRIQNQGYDVWSYLWPPGVSIPLQLKTPWGGKSVQLSHRKNGSMDLSLGQELRVSVFPLLTPSIGVWDGSPHTTQGSWQQTQTGSVWKPSQRPMVPPGAGRGETTSAICVHLKLFSLKVRFI